MKERVCAACGAKETETIPALEAPAEAPVWVTAPTVWTKGSEEGLTFVVDAKGGAFVGVKVDGIVVDVSRYTVMNEETVEIHTNYLENLSEDSHEIEIEYTNGKVTATFEVEAEPFPVVLIIIIAAIVVAAVVVIVIVVVRRRNDEDED